jgi:deoxycytidylate deaminase
LNPDRSAVDRKRVGCAVLVVTRIVAWHPSGTEAVAYTGADRGNLR